MRYVVTGGAGFLGSWLCESLLGSGNEVVCIDNLITGSKSNIKHLLASKKFTFFKRDILGLKALRKFDVLFHMSSPASPKDFEKYPLEILLANSDGTRNILDIARKYKAKTVYASTSEVYGDPKEHPQKESYWGNVNPNGIRSCYDESKRFGEALCMAYHRLGSDVRIARIFNTYGPRMRKDDGRVIPSFVCKALMNEPITVYGNGRQTRSFCYASDMIKGLILMSECDANGEVINIGNPDEYRIIDIARKIKKLSGSGSEIAFDSMPKDDPSRRKPDISKAKSVLKWEPSVKIDEGLRNTIDYFRRA